MARGRGGGISGAAGYDFQDIYVALQLAGLLVEDREPVFEVIWEKKALDHGDGRVEPVYVDDLVIRTAQEREIYVQVKSSSGNWSAARLASSGVLEQFWRQWHSAEPGRRQRIVLRLAATGDVTRLVMLADAARRSRTSAELLSGEASKASSGELRVLAKELGVNEVSPELLDFLKAVHVEQLPDAAGLDALLVRCLNVFGDKAPAVADRVLRMVAESKHSGRAARCAHTRATLLAVLREDRATEEALMGAGFLEAGRLHDSGFWDAYRDEVMREFRTFRVYGLQVERAVFADLPSLFVPLRLRAISEKAKQPENDDDRRELPDRLFASTEDYWRSIRRTAERESLDLGSVLSAERRIGLVGGPGCGKTTTLRWLAIVAASSGEEGRETRMRYGLPAEPLVPIFVRFRRLAQRVRERGLVGIAGRAALVAEFLQAEFEAGFGGRHFTKIEALGIAQELLGSDSTLFLFDALDEVPDPEMRAALFDAVTDLLSRYPRPRVVFSSRPYAVRREAANLELPLFEPLPLDRAGRRMFARHWYQSVRTHLGDALGPETAASRADELAAATERTPDLAETPLLLSILALVHFNQQGLPVERAVLYDQATLAMLGHWDRDPAGRNLGDDAIPLDWALRLGLREREIRRVVECLALDAQCAERGGDFTEEVAVAALSRGLEAVSADSTQRAERARLLLRLLADRSGLIQERSPGLFAFAHLNFQEYLAARALVGLGDRVLGQIVGLAADGRHAEVVRLAVGVLAADQRAESDRRAVALIESVGERHAFLAATCLAEAPRLPLERSLAESLARAALEDTADGMRHHERAGTMARAVWPLLERSERADELLLEFLSCSGGEGRRFPREEEWPAAVLGMRPSRSFTPVFEWFLKRLADCTREHSFLGSVAKLLVTEAGNLRTDDQIKSLVWILQWPRETSGGLEDRAATVLTELATRGGPAAAAVQVELAEAIRHGYGGGFRAANVWLRLGYPITPEVASVLVQALGWAEHEELCPRLVNLARQPESRSAMVAALWRGLEEKDGDVRRGVTKILSEAGFQVAASEGEPDDGEQAGRAAALAAMLADPASASDTLAALGDEIWEEDPKVAWPAAKALAGAGRADVPGVLQALVRAGLRQPETRARAVSYLRELRTQPDYALGVRAALLDGLSHEESAVATASAILLIDCGDAVGERRMRRIVAAAMRDPAQISDAVPRLQVILDQTPELAAKVIGEGLGAAVKTNRKAAGRVVALLAARGKFDAQGFAETLVEGGLAELDLHEEVLGHLRRMLGDPATVTETRKALAAGLESRDRDVVWGAARCLWEIGVRGDPELPVALVGLLWQAESRASRASEWLGELLKNAWTRAEAVAAAEAAIGRAFEEESSARSRGYGGGAQQAFEQAWRIARLLVQVPDCRSDAVIDATIFGGLSERGRQDEALEIVATLTKEGTEAAGRLEERLWKAVEKGPDEAGWGAIRALRELFAERFESAISSDGSEAKARMGAVCRVLLQKSASGEPSAGELLKSLIRVGSTESSMKSALADLTHNQKDVESAFAAASCLIDLDLADPTTPSPIVRGLGHWQRREKAEEIIRRLWSHPSLGPAVRYALRRETWSGDSGSASLAALLLMDHGIPADAGILRGLALGTGDGWRRRADGLRRLRNLLEDPAVREVAIETLRVELHGEHPGERFALAALLVKAGADFDPSLLRELGSERSEHWPHSTLAALALSGRVSEAREAAKRQGFPFLVRLLGSDK